MLLISELTPGARVGLILLSTRHMSGSLSVLRRSYKESHLLADVSITLSIAP